MLNSTGDKLVFGAASVKLRVFVVRSTARSRSSLSRRHSAARLNDRMSIMKKSIIEFAFILGVFALSGAAVAEKIGEVDTVFKLIGPDHKIVVDAYDDPKVAGVTCFVSRAKSGGVLGAVGLAEDKAEASIACRQVGPISFAGPLREQEEIFNERLSILFKKLRVVRMVDKKRNTLVYLTYSDRVIDGSPKNSVTAVPVDRTILIPVK